MQHIRLKNINKLAIPALISGVSEPLLSITDTAIIGHMPEQATGSLAAIGIVGTFLSMLIWVLGQTRSALSAIISYYVGTHQLEVVKYLPAQVISIILVVSVLLVSLTYPFANDIFQWYNAKGQVLDYCVLYYRIRVLGFPFTLMTFAIYGVFNGLQNTNLPMRIALIGVVLNIVLDIILVYGIPGVLKPMYIKGAAFASVIAQVVMLILAVYYVVNKMKISLWPQSPLHPELPKVLSMILNLFVRTLALNITLYLATRLATGYGEVYIAAYTIAINLWFLGAFIVDGYAVAGQILSGKLLGAKDYNGLLKLNVKLLKIGLFVGGLLALLGLVFYPYIGGVFTKDLAVQGQFNTVFWLVLVMQPLCTVAFIYDGIFKGLGQMVVLRNVLLGATFLVFLPMVFVLESTALKLTGVFIAIMLWMFARTIPLHIYFRRKFRGT
jgi:putative MATE family efflux protein